MIKDWFRKLFLVKEIVSRQGEIHFRRYRVIQTPWFAVYVHQICQSDLDKDMHDHPWNYTSLILKGIYREASRLFPYFDETRNTINSSCDLVSHRAEDAHQLTLLTPEVWTLVFTSGRNRVWGYRLSDNSWMDHKTYRKRKNTNNY